MIPYGRQEISQDDIDSVVSVLKSDFLTQGPCVPAFEEAVRKEVGARHAIAVNSATSALHISCLALGLAEGDVLWTAPNTFVASANCGLYCGAEVDFVDIDPETLNMCTEKLEQKLEEAEARGKLPKVVVPVHMTGLPCDMAKIYQLSRKFGFKIIEDASHAVGASYLESRVGSCKYSDITVFSFHPVKIITSGEGGMALTNCGELAARLELLRSHGITRDPVKLSKPDVGGWYYEQQILGFNYRMTDLQAALGVSQLTKLSEFVRARTALAANYTSELGELPLTLPCMQSESSSSWHLYIIRVQGATPSATRRALFQELRRREIGVN